MQSFQEPSTLSHSAAGVQAADLSKIPTRLENIFAAHKGEPARVYAEMKREWPQILNEAFSKDRSSVQGSNTFSGTVLTNFLIMGVVTKLFGRFAAAAFFCRDADTDPYKPLAAGIRKFNSTTTDGSKVGKNVTNFEALSGGTAGNPDSQIDAVTITPDQYTAGGYINNSQLNSGFRVADLIESKIIDIAAKITQVITAPITTANFVTNAPLVIPAAAFGFNELADLQGTLKKARTKNLLLDGDYIARIANTPGFFQNTGTVGGSTSAWSAFGWDNIALNTDWSGAGANVKGFACDPRAIATIFGVPLAPDSIPGNNVQVGVAQLPDVQIALATYVWFSAVDRTLHFSFDSICGATLLDETCGRLVKSA